MMRLPDALEREFLDALWRRQHMPCHQPNASESRSRAGCCCHQDHAEVRAPAGRGKGEGATTDQLEAWAERILSADSLEALLKE
jgi:hypothetical protein